MIRPIGLRYRNSIKFCIQDASHVTSENTLREFPLVIATVAKVSRKRGLWLLVCVKIQVVANSRVRYENVPNHILFLQLL